MSLSYILYNLILLFLSPLILIFYLLRVLITNKEKRGFKQRLGFFPKDIGKSDLWVHAVSVGEAIIASSIILELKSLIPQLRVVVSTITDTGNLIARKNIFQAEKIFYFPLDFLLITRKILKQVSPHLIVLVDTELWPNFLYQAKRRGAKILLVNGRISPQSFKTYRYFKFLTAQVLKNIDLFAMQSKLDAQRIISLGAEASKVKVTGNVKFDQAYPRVSKEEKQRMSEELNLPEGSLIWVAGSTHPGEEEKILEVFEGVREEFPHLFLILAPRHPERVGEVERIIKKANLSSVRRTKSKEMSKEKGETPVIILDTMGELSKVYSLATLVFVGKSLISGGGQNILEPAALGKVVLFGPSIYNFLESAKLLLPTGAAIQVKDEGELKEKILELLNDLPDLEEMGKRAMKVIEENKGAARTNAFLIKEMLNINS